MANGSGIASRGTVEADPAYIIKRLQEINVMLLPDFPGKTPTTYSVAQARSMIIALIADVRSEKNAGALP